MRDTCKYVYWSLLHSQTVSVIVNQLCIVVTNENGVFVSIND